MNCEKKVENKKAGKAFIVIMIAALLLGAFLGFIAVIMANRMESGNLTAEMVSMFVMKGLAMAAPYVMWLTGAAALGYGIFAIKKGKKEFAQWDMEDEAVIDKIDTRMNIAIVLSNNILILAYFLFAAHTLAVVRNFYRNGIMFILTLLAMVIIITGYLLLQQKMIDFVKEMNPEKKGSVYDMKFQDKWMNSCDEAEQIMIYKAAYKAYAKVNTLCMGLFVFFFFLSIILKLGLLPIAIVLGIMVYSQLVYLSEAAKYGKHQKKETEN